MYNDGHPSPEQVSRDYFRQNAPSAGNKSDSYEYSRGYAPRVGGYGALLFIVSLLCVIAYILHDFAGKSNADPSLLKFFFSGH